MDKISIEKLEVYAYHGVYEEEKKQGQRFLIDATLFLDISEAARKDDLSRTVNYGEVCRKLDEWMREQSCDLLETVALELTEKLLLSYPMLSGVRLVLHKPEAPIGLPFGNVSVSAERSWHQAFLSIGSNIGDKRAYLEGAVEALRRCRQIRDVRTSSFLETKPYGGVEQDDFLNGAVAFETILSPKELLAFCHEIENRAGRTREIHWGPRTLDLDILFYDQLVYADEELILPHVDLENREFVLKPLNELAPWYRHPISKLTVAQLLKKLTGELLQGKEST